MIPALRFSAAVLIALAAVPVVGWLLLVCADFLGLEDSLSPQPGWIVFVLFQGAATTLPPAFHTWPDVSRRPRQLLREGARAALLSFALFGACFLLLARPMLDQLGLPDVMIPMIMVWLAGPTACPLAMFSYMTSRFLLPRPEPDTPAPRAILIFSRLSLLFVILLAIHPFLLEHGAVLFPDKVAMFCGAWIFLALRHVIVDRGNAGFIPAWGALCLLSAFGLGLDFPGIQARELAVMLVFLTLMITSCFFLIHPDSRRWLK